ncbi:MAG: hypothetical protein IKM45_02700 [Opitutales bacterium]|nr:hypothetical protein [Opitutales bacterium]
MDSFYLVLVLCGVAVMALLLNIRKKLPKYIFVFLSVSIIVSVSWYTMDSGEGMKNDSVDTEKELFVFAEVSKNISADPGKTKISIPAVVSGKRNLDCIRMAFSLDSKNLTEQTFIEKTDFLLLSSDGTLLPASSIQFVKEESTRFPENFILKAFFVLPENLKSAEFQLVVENKFSESLFISEVAVASSPFLEK